MRHFKNHAGMMAEEQEEDFIMFFLFRSYRRELPSIALPL